MPEPSRFLPWAQGGGLGDNPNQIPSPPKIMPPKMTIAMYILYLYNKVGQEGGPFLGISYLYPAKEKGGKRKNIYILKVLI